MKKFFIVIILLTGFALLGLQIYQKAAKSGKGVARQRQNAPVAVEVATVKRITIREVKSGSSG